MNAPSERKLLERLLPISFYILLLVFLDIQSDRGYEHREGAHEQRHNNETPYNGSIVRFAWAWIGGGHNNAEALLAIFTILLMVVTAGLWFHTRAIAIDAKTSAEESRKLTLEAATAYQSSERAYVKMAHALPGLEFEEVRMDRRYGKVTVKVTNHGRTPATITDAVVGLTSLEWGEPLPEPFPYMKSEEPRARQAFLAPAEWFSFVVGRDFAYPGNRQIWIFGHVDYVDIFGQRHRNGWARLYVDRIGDNLIYAEEHIRQYNYDRKRTKDEGNDW